MTHRRPPTGTRIPDNAPRSLDEVGNWLLICGATAVVFLLAVTTIQWIASVISWDRLIAYLLGMATVIVGAFLVIVIAGFIVSNPRRRTPFL